MIHPNPYTQQLIEKGFSVRETRQASRTQRTFPCVIGARRFETEAEYLDALHDFLNGI